MLTYTARRVAQLVPTVFVVAALTFFMIRALPGDPATFIAGENATRENVANVRHQLGLDQSLGGQFLNYLHNVVVFQFGHSLRTGESVGQLIAQAFPITLTITAIAIVIGTIVAVVVGALLAYLADRDHTMLDSTFVGGTIVVEGTPEFVMALILLLVTSVQFQLLPASANIDLGNLASAIPRLIAPVLVLAAVHAASLIRITRTSILEVLREDYVRTARANGASHLTALLRHGLPNSLLPITTMAGLSFGRLLGGSVVVEVVFTINGMGSLLVNSIGSRDYPVVQALVFVYALLLAIINLLTDLLYRTIDPRVALR